MAEPRHYYYNATVTFTGTYFTITANTQLSVDADDDATMGDLEDRAVQQANEWLEDYYGWDVENVSNNIDVQLSDGF